VVALRPLDWNERGYKLRLSAQVTIHSPLNRGRAMLQRKPYDGLTRQLVLAFDIGTTYSGISFCILQPGEIPQPQSVMK
jgi:hypothetical protein